jgi:transposase
LCPPDPARSSVTEVKETGSSMTVTTTAPQTVVAGIDTHQRTHHVCVLDEHGRKLADREFPASTAGYQRLLDWVASFGLIARVGVESTGSYGAGLARHLTAAGIEVTEVTRPEKATRAARGKSDPIDAESAARQVLAGRATGKAKTTTGIVEAIRAIKIPRDSAVKDRTRAISQLRDLITTAPGELRDQLLPLTTAARVKKALTLRPDPDRLAEPLHATKRALQVLARRIRALDEEIAEADKALTKLVKQAAPTLLAKRQIGPQTAAQLLVSGGQNIHRLHSEAAFARLCGVAPIPASSGKSHRMRLSRGGDRQANHALYMIAIGRLKDHAPTIAYYNRREAEGLGTRDIIRCLKRYIAREVHAALVKDLSPAPLDGL